MIISPENALWSPLEPHCLHFCWSPAQPKDILLDQLYTYSFQDSNSDYWDHISLVRAALGSPEINQNVKNDHFSGAGFCDHQCSHVFVSFARLQHSQNECSWASCIYHAFRHSTWSFFYQIWLLRSAVGSPEIDQNVKYNHFSRSKPLWPPL